MRFLFSAAQATMGEMVWRLPACCGKKNIPVKVFIVLLGNIPSKDFLINKQRLEKTFTQLYKRNSQ
jgi:hypothetical protein